MIDRATIIAGVRNAVATRFGGDYKKAFDHFDTDGDGQIDRSELCVIIREAGVTGPILQNIIARKVIAELDTNGDGLVSFAEFMAVVAPAPSPA